MSTCQTVDYTKPRDICHLQEDIQVFTDFYKQENPDCTLKEYLEEEISNIPYYKAIEMRWEDVIDKMLGYLDY